MRVISWLGYRVERARAVDTAVYDHQWKRSSVKEDREWGMEEEKKKASHLGAPSKKRNQGKRAIELQGILESRID
jgi:hypothetical protein